LSVSEKLVYLYLSACICSTKEHDLRALSGQLNRQSQVFKPSQHSKGAVCEGGLVVQRKEINALIGESDKFRPKE